MNEKQDRLNVEVCWHELSVIVFLLLSLFLFFLLLFSFVVRRKREFVRENINISTEPPPYTNHQTGDNEVDSISKTALLEIVNANEEPFVDLCDI